ncbi:MAG: hypothetical protein LBP56_06490, partial [Odoribacteraceae bacterium]|nr:hypothetical protein [Odoribacteraceae bacterium]
TKVRKVIIQDTKSVIFFTRPAFIGHAAVYHDYKWKFRRGKRRGTARTTRVCQKSDLVIAIRVAGSNPETRKSLDCFTLRDSQ